ncbi:nucleotide-binding alpha-beta plait domain-containing protein [Artemisia annua]|uniref:Nucleotide-binding alpha-beta plait domain-containing protein n=1 Tax=Artemisia annua TaxID=35608 RepID=A0A2U1NYB5_ARTAN|nr:nucleotide-binding alpha-beta plait domain-containing protein [Artemisia annua]
MDWYNQSSQNEWKWTFGKNRKNVNNKRGVEQFVTTLYVTNFPNNWNEGDLWKICNEFGAVVDVYIARKLSKIGRRFAFVRFIRVYDSNKLITDLCAAWFGNYHLFASLARFQRKSMGQHVEKHPKVTNSNATADFKDNKTTSSRSYASLLKKDPKEKSNGHETLQDVLIEKSDMVSITDAGTIVMGKVRDLNLIENLRQVCHKEGFANVEIKYIGGFWVWIEFNNRKASIRFKQHSTIATYFHSLIPVSKHFVVDERVLWVEILGLPLCAWSLTAFKKVAAKWGEILLYVKEESVSKPLWVGNSDCSDSSADEGMLDGYSSEASLSDEEEIQMQEPNCQQSTPIIHSDSEDKHNQALHEETSSSSNKNMSLTGSNSKGVHTHSSEVEVPEDIKAIPNLDGACYSECPPICRRYQENLMFQSFNPVLESIQHTGCAVLRWKRRQCQLLGQSFEKHPKQDTVGSSTKNALTSMITLFISLKELFGRYELKVLVTYS